MKQGTEWRMLPQKRFIQLAIFATAILLTILLSLRYRRPSVPDTSSLQTAFSSPEQSSDDGIDWSQFAYVQYVTTIPYLCNSVMLFDRLHQLGSKADRLLLYPREYSLDLGGLNTPGALLRKARDKYGAILIPIDIEHRDSTDRKCNFPQSPLPILSPTHRLRANHDSDMGRELY